MDKGNYDEKSEEILREMSADAVLLIVLNGTKGHGFSVCSVDENLKDKIPDLLRTMADLIENGPIINKFTN